MAATSNQSHIISRKPGRIILLTALLIMLPLLIPGIAHVLRIKQASYREMLPSFHELISFKGSAASASNLPGASAADGSAQVDLAEPPAGAGSIADSTHALDSFYASLARTDAKQAGAITPITHYGDR